MWAVGRAALFERAGDSLAPRKHAVEAGLKPWQISFQGTLQTLNQFLPQLQTAVDPQAWLTALLIAIATHKVGDRPDRVEPRLRKRRPKPY
ncbi:MAG TPA: hypothetical protein VML55_00070, partial [Planctomycetaceae bacterium]|nr:hypothetical protein [Planctomycetaceae bacterium]